MNILEQAEFEVGGHKYLIQAMPYSYGMKLMDDMAEGALDSKKITEILKKSIIYKGRMFKDDEFERHFSRRYKDSSILLNHILEFNFGADAVGDDGEEVGGFPLGVDSLESGDTSEE